jgi:hypothetical protein
MTTRQWRRDNFRLDWVLASRRGERRNLDVTSVLVGLAGVLLGGVKALTW